MKNLKSVPLLLILTIFFSIKSVAQFNSGSTGADGALDLASLTCPNNICRIQLPESGVLNLTTVNVPAGKTLRFISNTRNTAVYLLTQGNVSIAGVIDVSGVEGTSEAAFLDGQRPGPGGFWGGGPGTPGLGPGGGTPTSEGKDGRWVGPLSLTPLIGGSGGGGYPEAATSRYGSGGGGAIAIFSTTSIVLSGAILARGGIIRGFQVQGWGNGSGGSIRLVANSITASGGLYACGRSNSSGGGVNNCGVIRLEATTLSFTGTSDPLAVSSPINPTTVPSSNPVLTLVSIGGFQVPSYTAGRFDLVDLLLPNHIPDPVDVVVSAQNIPVGTQVTIGFVGGSPGGTSVPCSLSGSLASSTCTAAISNLTRTLGTATYLLATAAFDPPASAAVFNPKGKDHVAKVILESPFGGSPRYKFLRFDGSAIDVGKLSKEFLKEFGM